MIKWTSFPKENNQKRNVFVIKHLYHWRAEAFPGLDMNSLERGSLCPGAEPVRHSLKALPFSTWACCVAPTAQHGIPHPAPSPSLPPWNTEGNNVTRGDVSRVHVCPLNINETGKYFKRDKFLNLGARKKRQTRSCEGIYQVVKFFINPWVKH